MKRIILFLTFCSIAPYAFSQTSINATVECPPCRPISSCELCWETQQQADEECGNIIVLGVDDFAENSKIKLTITPNPIKNGSFTVTSSKLIDGDIIIINQLGATIKTITPTGNPTNYRNIELNLQSGLYFMIYNSTNKKEKITKKLIFTN